MSDAVKDLLVQALEPFHKVRVLALDPGETTGACVFEGPKLLDARQLKTGLMPLAAVEARRYILGNDLSYPHCNRIIDHVAMEDYRVYSWKAKDHAWEGLHTPRLVGAVELICHDTHLVRGGGWNLHKQTAQQAKGFCTDEKLRAWGLWQEGQRHARDAIRHALYYLLFGVAQIHIPADKRKPI